jgi:hypothetical protein
MVGKVSLPEQQDEAYYETINGRGFRQSDSDKKNALYLAGHFGLTGDGFRSQACRDPDAKSGPNARKHRYTRGDKGRARFNHVVPPYESIQL